MSVILCGGLILWGNDSVSRAVRERLVTQSSGSDVSVTERKELASRAWDIIDEHQAMGTGAGTFVRELADYPVVTPRGLRVMQPVHSVPLLMLSEVGIIGCVLLGLAAGVMLWKETISVKGILIVGTIVLLGLMDHYLWSLPQGMGISLVAAVWYFMKV